MQTNNTTLSRTLTAGLATVALAGALTAPVQAAGGIQPILRTPIAPQPAPVAVVKPVVPIKPELFILSADLVMEQFDVTAMAGGKWKLRAVLRNGSASATPMRQTYPGGGWLVISRTSGGMIPVPPPPSPFVAVPDGGQILRKVAIPALANGQAMTVEAITQGRAIFTAAAVPNPPVVDGPTPTLPEINKGNNSKTVNKLIPLNLTINGSLLRAFLAPLLDDLQIHLHKTDSFIKLPGFFEKYWNIPQVKKGLPWPLGDAYWYVNNINLSSSQIDLTNRSMELCLKFETSGDEIIGWVDGGPDWLAPNVNANPLDVCVRLPLAYNAYAQFFYYTSPQVTVNANWSLNGPLPDSLLPNINSRIETEIRGLLTDSRVKQELEYELNRQIRNQLLKGGRILSASIDPSQVRLSAEVGG